MKSIAQIAALSVVSAQKITLNVESSNPKFSKNGLSNIHFGAAINGVILTNQPAEYKYNGTSKTVYEPITLNAGKEVVPFTIAELGHDLIVGVSGEPAIFDNGYLTFNGSNNLFYACKTLAWDPNGYTSNPITYGVGVYNDQAPDGCESIKIRGEIVDDNSLETASSSDNGSDINNVPSFDSVTIEGLTFAQIRVAVTSPVLKPRADQGSDSNSRSDSDSDSDSTASQGPDSDSPATQGPGAGSSATEGPNSNFRATQGPGSELSATQRSDSESRLTQGPGSEPSRTQGSNSESFPTQGPGSEPSGTQGSNSESFPTQGPGAETSAAQGPDSGSRATQRPGSESFATQSSATQKSASSSKSSSSTRSSNSAKSVKIGSAVAGIAFVALLV